MLNWIFQYLVAFFLSMMTAYIDLATFFKQKAKFRVSLWSHFPTLCFFFFNGALAWILMFVAKTNHWITDEYWSLAFMCGLGTAGLLRSKVFTFGQDNEVGFEFIYNFIKNQAIAKLIYDSGAKIIKISYDQADKYTQIVGVFNKVDIVADEIAKSPNWDSDLSKRFRGEYDGVKNGLLYPDTREKLAAMFRVFINYSDLKYLLVTEVTQSVKFVNSIENF